MESEKKPSLSAGGIVIGDAGMIALIRNRGGDGSWLFPKGHLEPGETDEEAARREIEEETGLKNLELLDDLGIFESFHIKKEGGYDYDAGPKHMHMFLFAAEPHAELAPTMEIEEAKWFSYRELGTIIGDEKGRVWYGTVFDRVREAIQRD